MLQHVIVPGTCKYVQLLAGPENEIVTTFSRIGPPNDGLATEYLSHSDHLLLFYAHELNAWAVGELVLSYIHIICMQHTYSTGTMSQIIDLLYIF